MQATIIHVFEQAGLGLAPFRFVGLENNNDRAAINSERRANGQIYTTNYCTSCDYCSTAICDAYYLESADGKQFKVGCDCVLKTGDAGLINIVKKLSAKAATDKRHAREAVKFAEGAALFARPEVQAMLSAMPHPRKWPANKGETMLDSVKWMLLNAGTAGKLKTYAEIAKLCTN